MGCEEPKQVSHSNDKSFFSKIFRPLTLNVPLEFEFPSYLSKTSFQSSGKIDINSPIFKINRMDAAPLKTS